MIILLPVMIHEWVVGVCVRGWGCGGGGGLRGRWVLSYGPNKYMYFTPLEAEGEG